jgi:hypothetical protein
MAAIGNGPFEFTDPNGKQVSIPLAALKFTSGVLDVDSAAWPPFSGYPPPVQAQIKGLLANLTTAQVLMPPVAASPKPAMVVNAADIGTAGNNITVAITVTLSADLDPTKATFNLTVTETEVYAGLSTATIKGVVGNETTAGSQPGLAHVVSASLNPALLPKVQSLAFPAAAPGVKATVDIVDAAATKVFTLEARKAGPDAQFAAAAISAVDSVANTFTLTLQWQHKVTGAKLLTVQNDLAPLDYEITVAPPASGIFSVPATTADPVALSGGSATASASAVVFASE